MPVWKGASSRHGKENCWCISDYPIQQSGKAPEKGKAARMIDLSYASALFISYAGILIGITLSIVSPEERKPLRKYFLMMKLIVPWLLIIASIYFSVGNWISFVFLGLFALYLLSGKSSGKITYIFLGALFFIASESPDFLVTASTIIFLFK